MKKIFRYAMAILAFGAMASSCTKEYPFPKDEPWDVQEEPNPDENPEYIEKTFTVDVDLIVGVETVSYGMKTVSMPKDEILGFFNMTAEQFYHAMGSYDATGQKDNTILFGLSDKTHQDYKWTPSSSGNFGHWMTKEGALSAWSESDSYWYLESQAEWGLAEPDEETLSDMWNFTLGFYPDRCTNQPGETIQATHVYYLEDTKPELYAYVDYVLHFVEPEEVVIDIQQTEEISLTIPYASNYSNTILPIDYDAIQACLGVPASVCGVYSVNSDGTYSLSTIKDVWFNVAGDVCAWGTGCGIDINSNNDEGKWQTCMFPDEELIGQTCNAAIVFVNEAGKGYLVKVAVTVSDKSSWNLAYELTVDGESQGAELSDDDAAAIAGYFGLEDFNAFVSAIMNGDIQIMPTNADGSYYTNADGTPSFSQEDQPCIKGVFFDLDGNATVWNSGNDMFYSTLYYGETGGNGYIEFEVTPFAAGEDEVGEYGYTWAFVQGDKVATVNLGISLASAVPWASYEVKDMDVNVRMTPVGGYKAFEIPASEIAALLCVTAEEYAEKYDSEIEVYGLASGERALNEDGTPRYTANGKGGCWFNAEGNVDAYANGLFFIEQNGNSVRVGQHGDAPAVGTEATLSFEYVLGLNSATVHYNITIVSEL